MKNNSFWRIATAAVVVSSVIGTYAVSATSRRKNRRKDGVQPEQQKVIDANPLTPPGPVFAAIWPLIYAGTTALSIYQALPAQRDNKKFDQSNPWLAASYVLNQIFGFFFASNTKKGVVGSSITTVLNLIPALGLHQKLGIGTTPAKGAEKWLRIPVSVYSGWLTAASVLAITDLLINAGWKETPKNSARWGTGLLAVTDGLGYLVSRQLNDPVYMTPFVVAFSGIAAKQYGKNNVLAGLAGVSALVYLGLIVKELSQKGLYAAPSTDAADTTVSDGKESFALATPQTEVAGLDQEWAVGR